MRTIAIYGPPGVGKTSAAVPLAAHLGAAYISSGDIARRIDPGALARGEMADRDKLRKAFDEAYSEAFATNIDIVVDGLPRDPADVKLLPEDTIYVLITSMAGTSIDRQMARGRPGDVYDLVFKRTMEQRRLMAMEDQHGWAYRLAGGFSDGLMRGTIIETTDMSRAAVVAKVTSFLDGR